MQFIPHNCDDKAHPWEWFPAEAQTTVDPLGSVLILERAPRNLKARHL